MVEPFERNSCASDWFGYVISQYREPNTNVRQVNCFVFWSPEKAA